MMRRAESHTASIAPIICCLPVWTSSSRHSISAVTPETTQTRIGALGKALALGETAFEDRRRRSGAVPPGSSSGFSPVLVSSTLSVIGVPKSTCRFLQRSSRKASSSTKRHAFCIAGRSECRSGRRRAATGLRTAASMPRIAQPRGLAPPRGGGMRRRRLAGGAARPRRGTHGLARHRPADRSGLLGHALPALAAGRGRCTVIQLSDGDMEEFGLDPGVGQLGAKAVEALLEAVA